MMAFTAFLVVFAVVCFLSVHVLFTHLVRYPKRVVRACAKEVA